MANVMHPHPHLEFHPGPVKQSPSAFGFGFGLSSPPPAMGFGWPSYTNVHAHAQSPGFQPSSAIVQPSPIRGSKRRHEPEDEVESENRHPRDESMDRSPTPERPKRSVPKRARVAQSDEGGRSGKLGKENKAPGANDANDVDVGVLLASLPPDSLLPLITSLLNAQPSLKPVLLALIPRPTLETAIKVLAQSAKKLRDAYPFSNIPTLLSSSPSSSSTCGFGTSKHNTYGSPVNNLGFGFGRPSTQSQPSQCFGQQSTGNRDSYVLSRLGPHIDEFVSASSAYLPYFSYGPSSTSQSQSSASATGSQRKDKSHPSETFTFLSALTTHILDQPPLTQSSLAPLLLPRLLVEWKAWVARVDEFANRQGGMYGEETVRSWERGLDAFADAKGNGFEMLREVRDEWVAKVGWLVGRMGHPMEEL